MRRVRALAGLVLEVGRLVADRLAEAVRGTPPREVVSVRTPAGWRLVLRERDGIFDSSLVHPNGDRIARSYWQADAHDAIEFALGYLAVRDYLQATALRGLLREELRR